MREHTSASFHRPCHGFRDHPFVGSGHLRPDAQAQRDLERENRRLREENEILKKAVRIFTHDRK
ncbi:transposase IS3/IS911 family protein [Alicyclobacillus acidocaldarius subsp. acidocaldarius Tc-4-1]|uniref:Transposase IS3/IS911 family protein n=1 Tax=Alicyclobacillus acidocaldarius (strain Tc-4-1) TaxID=1048834 RepID=F8ICU1_ALIAT|nr:transposase IS3/IS911 family protein [Alicyclobacillus acidocaldarius subsp. acidocaldarius Tc-4-1]